MTWDATSIFQNSTGEPITLKLLSTQTPPLTDDTVTIDTTVDVTIQNLDPATLGITGYIRYKKTTLSDWTYLSYDSTATGNTKSVNLVP
jgi:hypothetical protein